MAKSEKMYEKSPKLERDSESGDVKVKKHSAEKGDTQNESETETQAGEGQDGSNAEMGGSPEDQAAMAEMKAMHDRHAQEYTDMHARHSKDVKEMHKRHQKHGKKED